MAPRTRKEPRIPPEVGTASMKGQRMMLKALGNFLVGAACLLSVPAMATETEPAARCAELEKLIVELSPVDIATTRVPVVRQHAPERNYIWCLGIGFAGLDENEPPKPKAVILSFGSEPDGTIWLDFWEKREEPSFKWKSTWTGTE